jgi:hypothetical protein
LCERCVLGAELWQLHGQIGHVQGAGQRIQQAHGDEEECRAGEIEHDVVHRGLQALAPAGALSVQQQAVAGGQQHLEENEQVEEVAGEKGPVQAHQLDVQQRMEVRSTLRIAAERIEQGTQTDQGREYEHQR